MVEPPFGTLSEAAPAKINLCLHVTGRRDDGYHLLSSLVVFADIGDELGYEPSEDLSLDLTGPEAGGLAAEPDNLVLRAARALAAEAGREPSGRLTLTKRLPVASGIGGGSADAAAAMRLLARAWGVEMAAPARARLALGLGADVPMCLAGRPAVAAGIGEELTPLPDMPGLDLVLVNPRRPVSTPAVFRARGGPFGDPVGPVPTVSRADLVGWLAARRNDLEEAARRVEPAIGKTLDLLARQAGCRLARMSGSGATCFGIFDEGAAAQSAAAMIAAAEPGWWVRATRTRPDIPPS